MRVNETRWSTSFQNLNKRKCPIKSFDDNFTCGVQPPSPSTYYQVISGEKRKQLKFFVVPDLKFSEKQMRKSLASENFADEYES